MSLAATELAKFAVVIVLTLALAAGFTSTTTLSLADRVLATGSDEIFTSDIIIRAYQESGRIVSSEASATRAGVPNAAV